MGTNKAGNFSRETSTSLLIMSSSYVPGILFWLCLLLKRYFLPIVCRALKAHLWSQWHSACDRSSTAWPCGWKSQAHWHLQCWPLIQLHQTMHGDSHRQHTIQPSLLNPPKPPLIRVDLWLHGQAFDPWKKTQKPICNLGREGKKKKTLGKTFFLPVIAFWTLWTDCWD